MTRFHGWGNGVTLAVMVFCSIWLSRITGGSHLLAGNHLREYRQQATGLAESHDPGVTKPMGSVNSEDRTAVMQIAIHAVNDDAIELQVNDVAQFTDHPSV